MQKKEFQDNNFNILRLAFAIFVIITHSFVLSGCTSNEILSKLINGQINFSYIGLRGFFIISGYLIFHSFERSSNVLDFLWKRVLRIFPGLIAISIISIFIVGSLVSTQSFADYFTNKNTYQVFIQSIDLFFEPNSQKLPGVFMANKYGAEINGSLWTISYEFLFYLGFVLLFITKKKEIYFSLILIAIVSFLCFKVFYIVPWFKYEYYIFNTEIYVQALYEFGIFFLLGAFFACVNYGQLKTKYHKIISITLVLLISILLYNNLLKSYLLLLLVPCILSLGLLKASKYDITKKIGDISFGIYLSGFFIQQLYLSIYNFDPYLLTLVSVSTAIIYGLFSWNYIEKPALEFKNKFKKNNV